MIATRHNSFAVERRPIDSLRLPARPVRNSPKKQIEKARTFLAAHGHLPLIFAGSSGEIVFGAEYWLAAKTFGLLMVDCIVLHNKTDAELKTISLALHRIPEDGRWEAENVRVVLEELEAQDVDLDLTGFDASEIDSFLNLDLPAANLSEDGSDIPLPESEVVSCVGNIWNLGKHRLGCGDATDLSFVNVVLEGKLAQSAFVDPPYNIPIAGFVSGRGRHQHREFVQGSGELSVDQFFDLLRSSFQVLKTVSSPNAAIFACIDWRHVLEMLAAGRASHMSLEQFAVWVKAPGMGGIWRNAHEIVCIFRSGDQPIRNNVELGKRGRNRSNVWTYPSLAAFGKERDRLLALHPTVKPVSLIADALRDVTRRGDLVADTFCGSGSTLMAADETGRIFRGTELDPAYVDVAIRRWQTVTGRTAILEATGEPFASVQQRLLAAPNGGTA